MISTSVFSQNIPRDIQYRKDDRPKNNVYQSDRIGEFEILQALEMAGVRIFDIPVTPAFEKKYKLSTWIDEYVKGEKVDSIPVLDENNTYRYYLGDSLPPYFDYIPKLTFYAKEDTIQTLKLDCHGRIISGIRLKTIKIEGWQRPEIQRYRWRTYSKTDWKLNEEVPLVVYASAWYDEKSKIFRFCTVSDLSLNEERTKELYVKSPHYYVVKMKVSE
jgi:hypothetical protein